MVNLNNNKLIGKLEMIGPWKRWTGKTQKPTMPSLAITLSPRESGKYI